MKFYKRDPALALEGMSQLNSQQRGIYNSIIDLLYVRDGIVPDDDHMVAAAISIDLREYRNVKQQLVAAGKVRTRSGLISANGVDATLAIAQLRSSSARANAQLRWKRYKNANEFNQAFMPLQCDGNAIQNTDRKREKEVAKEAQVQVEFEVEMEDGSVTKVTRDEYFKILQQRDQARRQAQAARRAATAAPLTVEVDGKDVVRTSDALKELLRARDEFDALAAKVESKPERP